MGVITGELEWPAEKVTHDVKDSPSSGHQQEEGSKPRRWTIGKSIRVLITCIAMSGVLILGVQDCFAQDTRTEFAVSPVRAYRLVKDAIQTSLATPAATVLECFQVYQPVLFPKGAVDQVVASDGSENTTIISPTASNSSCQVLLMEHTFGFSYGIPFVGMFSSHIHITLKLTVFYRQLHTSQLHV